MLKSFTIIIAFILTFLMFFSCGFAYKKHITGKYFLIGVETEKDLHLSYKLSSGDFIGKAPEIVTAYGFNDSMLVVKSLEYKNNYPSYYIINMNRDGDYAREEDFRVGPITEGEYKKNWKDKLRVSLKAV